MNCYWYYPVVFLRFSSCSHRLQNNIYPHLRCCSPCTCRLSLSCTFLLRVPFSFVYLSPSCTFLLRVPFSFVYLSPSCTFLLRVPFSFVYLSPSCTFLLRVPFSFVYLSPSCTFLLRVPFSFVYLSPSCTVLLRVPFSFVYRSPLVSLFLWSSSRHRRHCIFIYLFIYCKLITVKNSKKYANQSLHNIWRLKRESI